MGESNTTDSSLGGHQKEQLINALKKYPILFSGGLGMIYIKSIHFEIKEILMPKHSKVLPIPKNEEAHQ